MGILDGLISGVIVIGFILLVAAKFTGKDFGTFVKWLWAAIKPWDDEEEGDEK